ncbi:hypothetical protein BJY27_004158 [Streptomyces rapamycinicus]|uniref:Uncharacterized protein n=2 Tax=Streptomyces rapamycinicus TaxID=1226757 RepID=A0A3L8RPE4_STRRN|nr:hypothetical protein [Streptomyces rapamycinicus]RLV81328.1 hypothetical protein D3C57_123125 [Streptomyces rapamycinicus NRRL 5491]
MVEVGSHWDAVRAPVEIGERALELLGGATGAVIADYAQMYWLIVSGGAQYWRRLPQVQALGAASTSYIGVPPIGHTTGPVLHRRVPLGPDCYLPTAPCYVGPWPRWSPPSSALPGRPAGDDHLRPRPRTPRLREELMA